MDFGNGTIKFTLAAAVFVAGCSNGRDSECTDCTVVRSALTSSQVLGFEDVTGWSTNNGTLSSSTIRSESAKSLGISGIGYAEIQSVALSSLGQVSSTISYDLRVPSPQPNPDWWGQTQLFIDCPSKGIYNAFIGARELIGSPLNQFRTVFYTISADMVTKLSGTYSDLRFKIVVNAPGGTGTYRLDNMKVAGATAPTEWPNDLSKTNSDPWLIANHQNVQKLKPQVLVINYDNNRGPTIVGPQIDAITAAFREGSRYRAYLNSAATSLLEPQTRIVDLRNGVNGNPAAPAGWTLPNSSLLPRRTEPCGPGTGNNYCFDFKQLFTAAYAPKLGFADPAVPGGFLNLCQAAEQGKVHEVWLYSDPNDAGSSMDETQEWAPVYNLQRQRVTTGDGNRCTGHGCFDADVPHCNVSLRFGYINDLIGPGFFIHSWSHSVEDKLWRENSLPFITPYFGDFADFNLAARYGMPFDRWYDLGLKNPDPPELTHPCDAIKWTSATSIAWHPNPEWTTCVDPPRTTVNPYVPHCGAVHFPPNARRHYDEFNTFQVMSTCQGWRRKENAGQDLARPFSKANFEANNAIAPGGASGWLIWWMQNMPGFNSGVLDNNNQPMLSFLPLMYY